MSTVSLTLNEILELAKKILLDKLNTAILVSK